MLQNQERVKRVILHTKPLADLLTLMRGILGIAIACLGMRGKETLPLAGIFLLFAWISDLLDGPLARRDTDHPMTWIGNHDLLADMTVAGGVWMYLSFSGYIHAMLSIGITLFFLVVLWKTRSIHVTSAMQAISYGAMLFTCLQNAPSYGFLLIGWLVFLVIVTWPRFLQKADEFIKGMASLFFTKN